MTDIITGDRLILAIGNMSFNGTMIILGILVLRGIMIKAFPDLPRKYIVWLWVIPFFRLLCPADLSRWLGKFSVLPWNSKPLEVVNGRGVEGALYPGVHPQIETGFVSVDQWMNETMVSSIPEPVEVTSIDPFQITQYILFLVWATGATALLLLTARNWWKLHRRVKDAVFYRRDGECDMMAPDLVTQIQARNIKIYESDRISTAFVVGWIRYRIYLPSGLSDGEADCVLLHEYAHIRRNDPIWKLVGYGAVIFHWFNPLVWIAYKTMIRDIEMACDERALEDVDPKQYTIALLKLSMRGSGLLTPLAFGEGSIKARIVNALSGKQPRRAICIFAALIIGIAAVACASNQSSEDPKVLGEGEDEVPAIVVDKVLNETAQFTEEELRLAAELIQQRTTSTDDHEKILDMIMTMDWGKDIELDMMTIISDERIQITFLVKDGVDVKSAVIDRGVIAANVWLLFTQAEELEDVMVEVGTKDTGEFVEVVACGYLREDIELTNQEALTHIVSLAQDPSLHEGSTLYAGEPTLWELGGDPETLLLLIRSLNVAGGVTEDELFGSAKDPGVAMSLPNLPVLPTVNENGEMSPLATAATQQLVTYIENYPYEIQQYQLREDGFVTILLGTINDNRNRWDYFMDRYCEDYPEESVGYPRFDPSGTGLGFSADDFFWDGEDNGGESGEAVDAGEPRENGGGLGDDVLLLAKATREGDWILMGILAYEDGFVLVRDISRDAYRDTTSAEYSVRMFEHLVYKEGAPQGDTMDYTIILTNEDPNGFEFDELPEIHWELYSGYRPKWELAG